MKRVLILLFILSHSAFALKEYYSPRKSMRSLGMGGANYALSNDESSLFYNPAGISLYNGGFQTYLPIRAGIATNSISSISTFANAFTNVSDTASLLTQLTALQGKPLDAEFGLFPHFMFKNFAFGILVADTKINFSVLGSGFDTLVESTLISDSGVVVGYGMQIPGSDIHVGINAKGLVRGGGRQTYTVLEVAQMSSFSANLADFGGIGFGVDFDLGGIWQTPFKGGQIKESRIAASFNNLLATNFPVALVSGTTPRLTRTFSVGGAVVLKGFSVFQNILVAVDFAEFGIGEQADPDLGGRGGSFWKHVNFGLEWPVNDWFALRGGFHQGNPTLGFGITGRVARLDFAWYGEEQGLNPGRISSRRLALDLSIGWGDWHAPTIAEAGLASKYDTPAPPTEGAVPTEKPKDEVGDRDVEPEAKPVDAPKEAPAKETPKEEPKSDTKTDSQPESKPDEKPKTEEKTTQG